MKGRCTAIITAMLVTNLFYYVLKMFLFYFFVWCPCMAITVSVIQHNGGFLPGIILLTQCYGKSLMCRDSGFGVITRGRRP